MSREEVLMDHVAFDALTRDAVGGVSRRRSLRMLGAAGVAATFAVPFAANAKKKGKKKHKSQKRCPPPVDRCAPQVGPCTEVFTIACGGNPDCQDLIACCAVLATCDFSGFINCQSVASRN
jgi:hypothetical protein